MTYADAYDMLKSVKAFTVTRKKGLDRRRKDTELVWEQLDNAYRICCVAENHLRVAERRDNGKRGVSTNTKKRGS